MDVEALRRERERMLLRFRDPAESPLAAVLREELPVGASLTVGGGPDDALQLEGLPPRALRVTATADAFEVEREGRRSRIAPGRLALGRWTLRLSHQNFPAVVVLDPGSPRLAAGPFPRWFDPDPALCLEARLARDPDPREEVLLSTRGQKRAALRVGPLVFSLQGAEHRLTAIRLLEPGASAETLSVFFRDATTGLETYPVGRYVDAEPLGADLYRLDFNRAWNPLCAYSPLFNCPIPPRENHLAVALRAGERLPEGPKAR